VRIGFFVWEYPPRLVGGLGTYAEYITHEFVELGHDVSVFTLNSGDPKTKEVIGGVERALQIYEAVVSKKKSGIDDQQKPEK
jgi:hypothetical protein